MANVKISNLTAASTPLAGTEVLPGVQSGATVKASIANVQTATYSGGTANGVAYLNGSKVLTTGSALVFDGTNLSTTGTVTATKGFINGATSAPTFSAYQSSAQTLSSATDTLTQFQTEEFDTGGCFNNTGSSTTLNGLTAPAYSFVPNVAGYYQVSFAAQGGAAITRISISIRKNATAIKGLQDTSSALVSQASGSALIYLNGTGDYIQAYTYFSVGQIMQTTASATWFQAVFVRSA